MLCVQFQYCRNKKVAALKARHVMKLSHLFLCKVHFQQRKKNGNAITSQGLFATLTLILHNQREEFEIGEQTIGIFFRQILFVCLSTHSLRGLLTQQLLFLAREIQFGRRQSC